MQGDWVILRTSGRHTMRLAASLSEDGFEAWTPVETKRIRIPRMNVRRDIALPLMPSYVFVKAHHLIDLIQLAIMPFKPRRSKGQPAHVDFSVMRYHDSIPTIGDQQLNELRKLEAKLTPRKKAQRFSNGVEVRVKVEGGSFAGMQGKVERSDEGMTLVCFDGRLSVRIATCLLDGNDLRFERSVTGTAARRAA